MKALTTKQASGLRNFGKRLGLVALLAAPIAAHATVPATTDDFYDFYSSVDGWSTSGLGIGLSILAILIGAGVGVARSTAMPALSGFAIAAVISWGPGIIVRMIAGGAVMM